MKLRRNIYLSSTLVYICFVINVLVAAATRAAAVSPVVSRIHVLRHPYPCTEGIGRKVPATADDHCYGPSGSDNDKSHASSQRRLERRYRSSPRKTEGEKRACSRAARRNRYAQSKKAETTEGREKRQRRQREAKRQWSSKMKERDLEGFRRMVTAAHRRYRQKNRAEHPERFGYGKYSTSDKDRQKKKQYYYQKKAEEQAAGREQRSRGRPQKQSVSQNTFTSPQAVDRQSSGDQARAPRDFLPSAVEGHAADNPRFDALNKESGAVAPAIDSARPLFGSPSAVTGKRRKR